tara:strand:+ start:4036 stop:4503 length:468 start_codon:yes stop_codon:yes gene_type:complete
MAILDTTRKPYLEDNDTNIFIGLDLPIHKSDGVEGYFASTSTTIEAVKNNIKNLLNTQQGERLMQPNFGIDLKGFLFEPITPESIAGISDNITATLGFWLPFVEITNLEITTADELESVVGDNEIKINIEFFIRRDPNTLASVQVSINNDNVIGV